MEEIVMIARSVEVERKINDVKDKDKDSYLVTLEVNEQSALVINRIKASVVAEAHGGTKCRFGGVDVTFNINKENLRR